MTVAVHQPNFIPWIGYFDKIAQSDVFVLLDTVQYPRSKSVANRNSIKTKQGALEVVVPIAHPKGSQRLSTYQEVEFAELNWKKKVLNTLSHAYGRTPFYNETLALLEKCFDQQTFLDMNNLFITEVVNRLDLGTKLLALSDLPEASGVNNTLIISICKTLKADTYLSGKGASAYNDVDMYAKEGLRLTYQSYTPTPYPQLHGDFIPNLSIIDALFNIGFEGTAELLKSSSGR